MRNIHIEGQNGQDNQTWRYAINKTFVSIKSPANVYHKVQFADLVGMPVKELAERQGYNPDPLDGPVQVAIQPSMVKAYIVSKLASSGN